MSEKPSTATADGEEGGATGNSEGGTTMALQKKRLRRVSFAEMTSIHFFDRDEDNETPADEAAAVRDNGEKEREDKNEVLGFRELLDSRSEDEEEDREHGGDGESEDEELALMRRSFLRPAESPSPGSNFGSATSNYDDDFFGPVSASFIRPGQLSDSAASNENHDVTMDSTAFSMHFRSLARSDSGVELKTPTGIRLSFEEKTPTYTDAGSLMELTVPKPITQLCSPTGNSGSSDMSLVGDKSSKYDYGRISPGLDALLAEGSKNLHPTSASDVTLASSAPRFLESKSFPSDEDGSGLIDIVHSGKAVSSLDNRLTEANDDFSTSAIGHAANEISSNTSRPLASDILIDYSHSSPSNLSHMRASPSHPDELGLNDKYIQHGSPLVELVSSLTSKGRRTLATSTPPTQYTSLLTPQGQRGSPLQNKDARHHESASSIQKSISKLKLLEVSPFSSYLTAKIENSAIESLNFPNSPFGSERLISDFQIQHVDTPARDTEEQPLGAFQKQQVLHASITNDNLIKEPVNGGHMFHSEESLGAAASPPESTWSYKKMKHDLFRSRSPGEKELVIGTGMGTSLAEIALCHAGEKRIISTPNKYVPSPDKELEKKLTSPKLQGQLSNVPMLHDQLMRLKRNFPAHHESASKVDITDSSIPSLNEVDPFSLRKKVQASSPAVGLSQFNSIEVNNHNQQSTFETIESLRTLAEAKECPKKLECGPQTGFEVLSFEGDHPKRESESAFPSVDMRVKELMLQKDLVSGITESPSTKEVQVSNGHTSQSNAEDVLSPSSNKLSTLSRKRSNEAVVVEERNHTNELASQRSPKHQKVGNHDLRTLGFPSEHDETSSIAHETKDWTDIYSEFFKDSEKLISPSMDKLSCLLIELLETFLFNLRGSKTYGILQSEISTQPTFVIDDLHHQRVSEARSLLHQIVHEKAKSQLLCLKRHKLQEKAQMLNSGIQESQMLKLKSMRGCKGETKAASAALQTLVYPRHREGDPCDKVIAMKQIIEPLDNKCTNLIKSLTIACKLKGESSSDIIASVTNHLMKKSRCRFIRLDMQMWIIDDVKGKNGHKDIVLNYLDFIVQSFNIPVPPACSMVISHKLEDITIMKNFPNMDACAAFSFVFNAEMTKTYSGTRSFVQEIQVTSSFVGNLVDVIQEVQLARVELRHLTRTTFHCPLAGQLYLQLGFFSFESGEKVTLTLDLSCLRRGVYPSEVLPTQLTVVYGAKSSSASPVLVEIRNALKSLRAGHTRILRLCRRVSQIVQISRK